jgi:hypothetical protein
MGVVSGMNKYQKSDHVIRSWMEEVGKAAASFESRWTELALRRVDADLGRRLHEQRNLYHAAMLKGAPADVELQGAALCRGYAAVTKRMEEAGAEDDAYQLGQDPQTGTKVAIGTQKAAIDRVRTIHGQDVVWITPDEVAALMSAQWEGQCCCDCPALSRSLLSGFAECRREWLVPGKADSARALLLDREFGSHINWATDIPVRASLTE